MCDSIIDLFCGCGGLSLGFEKAGFNVAFAIDMWPDAIKTFNHNHHSSIGHCMDIHDFKEDRINEVMLAQGRISGIVGGPPCQGYSTVGTRDVNDPRNHLYLEYCRVVEQIRPKFFVLENVKGLTTLSNGAFRDDIITRFGNLGYNVKYKIVNAADFGVPQNRHRVFFVGLLGRDFVFPLPFGKQLTSKDAISDIENVCETEKGLYRNPPQNAYQREMRRDSSFLTNHEITKHTQQTIDIINMIPDGGKISDLPREYWEIRKYNKAFERMASGKPANTVDTGHRNYFHYSQPRIPTARENARLQSFPDVFEILGTRTSQYKQIGNAVPPLLAFAIAKAIKEQL